MAAFLVGLLVPVFLSYLLSKREKKIKRRAVTVNAGGEKACMQYSGNRFLGARSLLHQEMELSDNGRAFEKVTMGNYVWTTYGQALLRANDFASGLVALGHAKGERVAIFAETRPEWFLALQACFRRNLTVVTIYASLGEEALAHSLNETEVTTVICDRKQLKKLVDLSRNLDTVKRVVYMEDDNNKSEPSLSGSSSKWTVASLSRVEMLGQQSAAQPDIPLPADIAVIMYTSGSTGLPKGVMMSHRNMVATVAGVMTAVPGLSTKDVYLAYLPLAHVLEIAAESVLLAAGAAIGYGSPLTLTDTSSKVKHGTNGDATELRPTLMTAVPAILDRVRDGVRKKCEFRTIEIYISELDKYKRPESLTSRYHYIDWELRAGEYQGGISKKLFDLAYNRRLQAMEGSWLGAWGLEKFLWDAVVFSKIKSALGGRVRGMLSGGAPLSSDTQRFINICFGCPIGQGYGLTETCAGATFSEWDDTSVGRLVNWDEGGYKYTDTPMPRGEIVIGGPNVTMGYFKNQAKTDEVYKVDERGIRWFYTGDIGRFYEDGCVEIIDRKKDIVKLQHGEYVSLGKVEAVLAGSLYLENIMLHADPFHSYCVAIVVPAQAALEEWAKGANILYSNFSDLCSNKEAVKEVLSSISKVAKQGRLEKFEIPAKIKLLPDPWTPESGLVTAAMKIKREIIRKAFAEDLTSLYK